jgi:hypothetical protein
MTEARKWVATLVLAAMFAAAGAFAFSAATADEANALGGPGGCNGCNLAD